MRMFQSTCPARRATLNCVFSEYKRTGCPIVVRKDGKVVKILPEERDSGSWRNRNNSHCSQERFV
jgi:hypothetical protein